MHRIAKQAIFAKLKAIKVRMTDEDHAQIRAAISDADGASLSECTRRRDEVLRAIAARLAADINDVLTAHYI